MAPSTVEHPIKIRGDNNDSNFTKSLWTGFFIANAIVFLAALVIPESRIIKAAENLACHNAAYDKLGYACQPFDIEDNPVFSVIISNMSNMNQFAVLEAVPFKRKDYPKVTSTEMKTETTIYEVDADRKILSVVAEKMQHDLYLECKTVEDSKCTPVEIISIPQVTHDKYLVVLKITNAPILKDSAIHDIKLAFVAANPSYSSFYIGARYVITIVAIISFIQYHISLHKYDKRHRSKEQTQLWWIGLQMIFFDDLLFYLTFTQRGLLTSILAIFPIISFASLLMHFWILSLERIVSGGKIKKTNNFFAFVYVALFYVSGIACYGLLTYQSANDPMLHFYNNTDSNFLCAKSIFEVLLAVGICWIVYRSCQIISRKGKISNRDNMFFMFSVFFAIIESCFLWTGAPEIYHDNSIRQILLFGLTNIYALFMLYLYAPTGEGTIELVRLPVAQTDSFRATEESYDEKYAKEGNSQNNQNHSYEEQEQEEGDEEDPEQDDTESYEY